MNSREDIFLNNVATYPAKASNERSFNKNSEIIKSIPALSPKTTAINNKKRNNQKVQTQTQTLKLQQESIVLDDRSRCGQATNTNSLNQINLKSSSLALQRRHTTTIPPYTNPTAVWMTTTPMTTTITIPTQLLSMTSVPPKPPKPTKPILHRSLSTPAFKIRDVRGDKAIKQFAFDADSSPCPIDDAEEAALALPSSDDIISQSVADNAFQQQQQQQSCALDPDQRFGCAHYKRRAMFVTPCCSKFYKCRFCHDENETHHFDRKTLTELICSLCNTRQRVQESCEKCGVRFGKYTCLICNLFDDSDSTYHCNACGICRTGRAENFFHCEVCDMCLPIQLKIDGHRCVENISRSHCPVCLGDIHTSRIPCHIPHCGHLLHKMCFDQLLTSGHYTCPTCQTSLMDMSALWEYLDTQAALLPIPKKYENQRVHIFCNDCHKASKTKFHFIGLKCLQCGAYNTTQDVKRRMSLVTDEPTTA